MRIDSAAIGMESHRRYSFVSGRVSTVTVSSGLQSLEEGALADKEEGGKQAQEKQSQEDPQKSAFGQLKAMKRTFQSGKLREMGASAIHEQLMEIRQECLNYLLDILFPHRKDWQGNRGFGQGQQDPGQTAPSSDMLASTGMVNVKTLTYSSQYYRKETESTSYSTTGTVRCADGREITFNLDLEMSRSFQEYYEENITAIQVKMCDPLVINLDGNIAGLSGQTFLFDIDGDGQEDEVNRLAPGSGYLALDQNGDGVINDGSELFGTKSGNGFADLAAYDTDHNGFIDEGDEIWDKLKIWVTDEEGNQQLYSLAEKGVGAICLQNAATNYAINGQDGQARGAVRSTGFFLYENGNVGTVQHVDLALHGQEGKEHREQEKIRQNQGKYEKWLYDMAM